MGSMVSEHLKIQYRCRAALSFHLPPFRLVFKSFIATFVYICLQLVYLPTGMRRVLILMAPPSPRLACNNEDSTFNNLDRQIKKRIQ